MRTYNHILGFKETPELPYKCLCTWRNAREQKKRWDQRRRRAEGTQRVCTCCRPHGSSCTAALHPGWEGPSSPGMSSALPDFLGRQLKCSLQTEQGSREQSSSQSTPRVFPSTPTAKAATPIPPSRQSPAAASHGMSQCPNCSPALSVSHRQC